MSPLKPQTTLSLDETSGSGWSASEETSGKGRRSPPTAASENGEGEGEGEGGEDGFRERRSVVALPAQSPTRSSPQQ